MKRLRKIVKPLVRSAADALIIRTTRFGDMALSTAEIAAKMYPYEAEQASYAIQQAGDVERGPDGLPIPPTSLWEGYASNTSEYLEVGQQDVQTMRKIVEEGGFRLHGARSIMELGCAAGRMLRCFADLSEEVECWGADIDARAITWCQQYLSPPFHFVTCTTLPHLPFEDGYFDFLYAGSVFTHITDLADMWLLELR